MIWTAVSFNPATEKVECEVFEANIDPDKAHSEISKRVPGVIVAITKGNHKTGTFIPDVDFSITRASHYHTTEVV